MHRSAALVLLLLVCSFGPSAAVETAERTAVQGKNHQDFFMNPSHRPIVLLGASYAAGLKIETLAGTPLINQGVGGQQSFEMLARFDDDVVSLEPATVILWGFINDIFRAERSTIETTLEKTRASYLEMISRARAHGIEPVLATEITMSPRPGLKESAMTFIGKIAGKESYQDYINSHVIATNQWLKETAAEHGLLVLDLQPLLSDGGIMRKRKYAQDDGSHLSDEAYRIIAEYMEAKLLI
jgi:lysophospholipase L1-like esterase